MTAIGGARDTLLQASAERFSTTADGKAILLAGSTPVFRVNSTGAGAPGSIAITAKPVNLVGDIVFSVSAGTQMTVNGNVATVDFATMTTDTALVQARIRAFGVDYVGNYMISKVFDGVAGETGLATFDAALEAERQKVDRIAISGRVPVNVLGAQAGDYIVPVQDGAGIKGVSVRKADLTQSQYLDAVGRVISIEPDGRAYVMVKVV